MLYRASIVLLSLTLTTSTAWGAVNEEQEADPLLAGMISLVVSHDVAIIAGLVPIPFVQYPAEAIEFSANLGLKALPPWLVAPPAIAKDPAASVPVNADYSADGCGIEFELLSAQAGYENMFGVANIRDPYIGPTTVRPWATRWGFLQKPRLYHANTTVKLSVGTPSAVRKYDLSSGSFSDEFFPIDTNAEKPQSVYLPIGRHVIEWRAGTELDLVSDIAIPGVLLAVGVLTEVKNAYGGLKAGKQVKKTGISESIVDAPLPADSNRLKRGATKFSEWWQSSWYEDKPIKKKIASKAGCILVDVAEKVLDKSLNAGVTQLEANTSTRLVEAGVLDRAEADLINAIWVVQRKARRSLAIEAIKLALKCTNDDKGLIVDVIKILLATTGIDAYFKKETRVSYAAQMVTVLDSIPPTFIAPPPLTLEATDFGGTRLYRNRAQMFADAEANASDNCGRKPEMILEAPEIMLIGETEITWTAKDKGPNPNDGQQYEIVRQQLIRVEDTQPPLLLAPPSKVIEATAAVALDDAEIGAAVAVDLADAQPQIISDAPLDFPLNRRTQIQWTATDQSGNAAQASQLITIKTLGSNTKPSANNASAQTLTARPVDIRLTASDVDELDGITDPLWFKIDSQPAKGEFIAPLFPFFIADYRTKPGDGLGEDFDPITDDLHQFIRRNYCDTDLPRDERVPPRNFVHEARFVHVTDDGIRYVLDEFFSCKQFDDNPDTNARFSKWNAAGDFLGQAKIGSSPTDRPLGDTFVIDKDGSLYYSIVLEPGSSSNELFLQKCNTDWLGDPDTDTSRQCVDAYKFENSSVPDGGLDVRSLSYARIDSNTNVAYVADAFSIFAFELIDSGGTRYLGELGPKNGDEIVDGWIGRPQTLEVGSDGSLFVADILHHRIHKIAPVTLDSQDELVLGDYTGWAGRCTGSGNKACDDDLQRSRGYSCTFEADSCTVAAADRSGSAQGQFDTPKFIAIDPNNILYIADYENERIQRLSPDGSFAGEAVSDGSGINKGDRPSFVLGNMGKPASVSVNSSQFYVVDRDEQFVHIFGTLPFKEITDDAVTVTYVSDQDFPNPNNSGDDTFRFSVSDGLASSDPATVTVTVNRNFRPPVALDDVVTTAEDTAIDIELPADDPDGIAGKDFLGLDTLTYTITSMPEHGELDGGDSDWTYTPDADFYGEDAVRFEVNDGRDDSNEATITITVTPVNDPPQVTIEVPERVARGFPTLVTTTFLDDPSDSYEGSADWGDGQTDVTGGIVQQDSSDDPRLEGVFITEPPMPGIEGQTFAEHIYEVLGPRTVELCVTDSDGLEGCDSANIMVESLVSLGFGATVFDEPLAEDEVTKQEFDDDVAFTFELTVQNGQPSIGAGQTAQDVVLDMELPTTLTVANTTISQGNCSRDGFSLLCNLGSLSAGTSVTLNLEVSGPGNLIYDEAADVIGILTTSSPAVEPEIDVNASVDLIADTMDSDGDGMSDAFEAAYGLDPTRDDGANDPDSDGLDNLREFKLRTSPLDSDSDGDGMPDNFEVENGLDPIDAADADIDSDLDGFTNLEEFKAGTDPQNAADLPAIRKVPVGIYILLNDEDD